MPTDRLDDAADLAAEVALGITHSTACSAQTLCCRCRATQLELCVRESIACVERMLAHPNHQHQWPMGLRSLRDRSKDYLKSFGTGAIQP